MEKILTKKKDIDVCVQEQGKCSERCDFFRLDDGWGKCNLYNEKLLCDGFDWNRFSMCIDCFGL
jgi:hypothetical protein